MRNAQFPYKLQLESLERRDVPAVSVTLQGTTLVIQGSDLSDIVIVDQSGPELIVQTFTEGDPGSTTLPPFDAGTVDLIEFHGAAGDDQFDNRTSIVSIAHGDAGLDILTGGNGDDQLFGDDDGDLLVGRRGDDTLDGGAGNDRLVGDGGKNIMIGGLGADIFFMGRGKELIQDFNADEGDTTAIL
jgi:Ca2+-binding RTX toxin-like protein